MFDVIEIPDNLTDEEKTEYPYIYQIVQSVLDYSILDVMFFRNDNSMLEMTLKDLIQTLLSEKLTDEQMDMIDWFNEENTDD